MSKRKSSQRDSNKATQRTGGSDRVVYSEFGHSNAATERAVPDLPPSEQPIRIQATRKGKGGKTVTVLTGFQSSPETLKKLLKKLKAQCGSGGTIKDQELEIQGDHSETLLQQLVKLGYPAKISGGRR
ncbi:MAG: translation initiation factor [Merismopedia sp. SIO2A8]|nr:translation initiation factor [Symploca sp. SIO2B6]NET52685.1 translation initiation factor [Merismopedia sp. SIO2A8]